MSELKKPKPSETCPPGYHIVRGHERTCHSGTVTWVDTQRCRPKFSKSLVIKSTAYQVHGTSQITPHHDLSRGLATLWLPFAFSKTSVISAAHSSEFLHLICSPVGLSFIVSRPTPKLETNHN